MAVIRPRRGAGAGRFPRAVHLGARILRDRSSEAFAWLAYAEMVSDHRQAAARAAIARAIALAPGRLDYRLRSADISVLEGEFNEANTLLTQLAAITTDPLIAIGAKARLEQVAEYQQRVVAAKARTAARAAAGAEGPRRGGRRPARPGRPSTPARRRRPAAAPSARPPAAGPTGAAGPGAARCPHV